MKTKTFVHPARLPRSKKPRENVGNYYHNIFSAQRAEAEQAVEDAVQERIDDAVKKATNKATRKAKA